MIPRNGCEWELSTGFVQGFWSFAIGQETALAVIWTVQFPFGKFLAKGLSWRLFQFPMSDCRCARKASMKFGLIWCWVISPSAILGAPNDSIQLVGDIRLVAAPIDFHTVFDNDFLLCLPERRGVVIRRDARASLIEAGVYDHQSDRVGGVLPREVFLNGYFVASTTQSLSRYRGRITFLEEEIVALIAYPEINDTQDEFALGEVHYDLLGGIDLPPAGGPDVVTISEDRRTLEFDFVDLGLHDSFRIVTRIAENHLTK
jgi:hypothetical protein